MLYVGYDLELDKKQLFKALITKVTFKLFPNSPASQAVPTYLVKMLYEVWDAWVNSAMSQISTGFPQILDNFSVFLEYCLLQCMMLVFLVFFSHLLQAVLRFRCITTT